MSPKIRNHRAIFSGFVLLLILYDLSFLPSLKAESSQKYYLNRIGFCNLEVGYDVHVVGNYAYITNNDGLMIVDITNPINPVKVGEIHLENGAFGALIKDSIAFIASYSEGFVIANVTNASNPIIIGQSGDELRGSYITIHGLNAYVSHELGRLSIFNIENLTNPILIATYNDSWTSASRVIGDLLICANPQIGIRVINVSNPSNPWLLRTIPNSYGVFDMDFKDNILYLACHQYGIKILNISNPNSPNILDYYDDNNSDEGEAQGIVKLENFLYIADNSGVEVFEIAQNYQIIKIADKRDTISAAHDIDVDNEYVYIALGGGLLILKLSLTPEVEWPIIILLTSTIGLISCCLLIIYFKVIKKKK